MEKVHLRLYLVYYSSSPSSLDEFRSNLFAHDDIEFIHQEL